MKKINYILLSAFVLVGGLFSCTDELSYSTDANHVLTFSNDTIAFDTVFSTIGSSTKRFIVYNFNDDNLRLPSVRLGSNGESGFRINVDGEYGHQFNDVELLGNDSIICFVEVTVNPQDEDNPVLIRDSILFQLESGVTQKMFLQAYGQDIKIFRDKWIESDTTLTGERPFVIYGDLVVDTFATLTIEAGTQLCFHANAGLNVVGRIVANGTKDKPIVFRCDRTDKMFTYLPYDRLDGKWGGITIDSLSFENKMSFVDVHGGNYGICCNMSNTSKDKLWLENSVIHNVGGSGLELRNCNTLVANSQISNCYHDCVYVVGGNSLFIQNTIAQFYPWKADKGCAFRFANIDSTKTYIPLTQLNVYGCLITGAGEDEVYATMCTPEENDDLKPIMNYEFDHCVLNTVIADIQVDNFKDCVLESDSFPAFKNSNFKLLDTYAYRYNFHLTERSTARGKSGNKYIKAYPKDRDEVERTDSVDAGCYQIRRSEK